MRVIVYAVAAASLALAGNASAQSKKDESISTSQGKELFSLLFEPPGQSNRPSDPDQGDDHASQTAIERVCSKDTPAARRAAICDNIPDSP